MVSGLPVFAASQRLTFARSPTASSTACHRGCFFTTSVAVLLRVMPSWPLCAFFSCPFRVQSPGRRMALCTARNRPHVPLSHLGWLVRLLRHILLRGNAHLAAGRRTSRKQRTLRFACRAPRLSNIPSPGAPGAAYISRPHAPLPLAFRHASTCPTYLSERPPSHRLAPRLSSRSSHGAHSANPRGPGINMYPPCLAATVDARLMRQLPRRPRPSSLMHLGGLSASRAARLRAFRLRRTRGISRQVALSSRLSRAHGV